MWEAAGGAGVGKKEGGGRRRVQGTRGDALRERDGGRKAGVGKGDRKEEPWKREQTGESVSQSGVPGPALTFGLTPDLLNQELWELGPFCLRCKTLMQTAA